MARRYSKRDLKLKLEAAGFNVKKITFTAMIVFPFVILKRFLQRFRSTPPTSDIQPLPAILNKILIKIAKSEARLLMRWSLPIGVGLIAVARTQKNQPNPQSNQIH